MRTVGRATLIRHLLAVVVALAALYVLTTGVSEFRNTQIATVAYTLCAVAGLTVLTGLNGQISLGQGAFMAVGGYTAILLQIHLAPPLFVLLLAALVAGAIVGALVGIGAARLRGPYLAGATLALAVGLPAIANYRQVSNFLGGENGLTSDSVTVPGGLGAQFPLSRWQAWICCLSAVFVILILANLAHSGVGRNWRAVRDDEVAAELCGLRVARVQLRAFIVSSACAGLGGGLLTVIVANTATPTTFNLALSLTVLSAVVIGGLGSLTGAVVGSIIIVLLPYWANDLIPGGVASNVSSNVPLAVYGAALILVMLVFPLGLVGAVRRLVGLVTERVGRRRALDPTPQPQP